MSEGTGINVSAMGTISPEEARELAALLIYEAAAVEAEGEPVTRTFTGSTQWNAEVEQAENERWRLAAQEARENFGRGRP